jgi:hypothetical protein
MNSTFIFHCYQSKRYDLVHKSFSCAQARCYVEGLQRISADAILWVARIICEPENTAVKVTAWWGRGNSPSERIDANTLVFYNSFLAVRDARAVDVAFIGEGVKEESKIAIADAICTGSRRICK